MARVRRPSFLLILTFPKAFKHAPAARTREDMPSHKNGPHVRTPLSSPIWGRHSYRRDDNDLGPLYDDARTHPTRRGCRLVHPQTPPTTTHTGPRAMKTMPRCFKHANG